MQVKSKKRAPPNVQIKLTNAYRFAKAGEACFVVLFLASDGGYPVRVYSRRFGEELIGRTLKRARELDQAGETNLHKKFLTITFEDADEHGDDLLAWMRQTQDELGTDYAAAKKRLTESLGFEDGRIFGSIKFLVSDLGELVDHTIGLSENAPVEHVRFVDRRFGIEAAEPVLDCKPDFVRLQSNPEPCTITVRGVDDKIIRFAAEMRQPGIPGIPLEAMKMRITADFLELIVSGEGKATLNVKFNGEEKRSLPTLVRLFRFLIAAEKGPLAVRIAVPGLRNFDIYGELPFQDEEHWMRDFAVALDCLQPHTHIGLWRADDPRRTGCERTGRAALCSP